MNYKRALGTVLLMCFASLLFVFIISILLGIELEYTEPSLLPNSIWILSFLWIVLISTVGSLFYFNSSTTTNDSKNGFIFGSIFLIISSIGNFLAFLPYEGGIETLSRYLYEPLYWIAAVVLMVTCVTVGHFYSDR